MFSSRLITLARSHVGRRSISTIGVVGGGQMGTGIAWVAAVRAKKNVLVMDVNQTQLDSSVSFAKKLLDKDVAKDRMTQAEADEAFSRIGTTDSLSGLAGVDFIVEAATENLDLKKKIFAELDSLTRPEVILASNTSSISITKLAAATNRADKVIGMHFFSPVPVMKLTEVISGLRTSPETLATTVELAQNMGKVTTSSQNVPGFISNRVLMPMINEAFFVLGEGIATKEDIDTTMKLGTNVPMGPLTLADFIGLDTCLNIMNVLHQGFGDSKYRPAPLLQQYVDAGLMGRKSGQGVYDYSKK